MSLYEQQDIALKEQVIADLKRQLAEVTAERDALLKTFPHCDKHKPNGGHRAGCIICSGEKLCAALSRIDYACEEPNEEEMSGYDLHCDEDTVIANVQKLRTERDTLKADAERYRWLRGNCVEGHMESPGPNPDFALNCDEPENKWDAAIDAAREGK